MGIELVQLLREAAEEIRRPLSEYGRDLKSRLGQAAASLEEQEPVAWQLVDQPAHIEVEYREYHRGGEWVPLYRHPPTSAVPEWQPIETAPKDNKRPLLLAQFSEDGRLVDLDVGGVWESESESWEMPKVYYFWASAYGRVEEPTHWMYEPKWMTKVAPQQGGGEQ